LPGPLLRPLTVMRHDTRTGPMSAPHRTRACGPPAAPSAPIAVRGRLDSARCADSGAAELCGV